MYWNELKIISLTAREKYEIELLAILKCLLIRRMNNGH